MGNYQINYGSNTIGGYHVQANSVREALEIAQEKYPNKTFYVANLIPEPSDIFPFIKEDIPNWEYREKITEPSLYGKHVPNFMRVIYDEFRGWHKDYGYLEYNREQLRLIDLRKEIKLWSSSINHPSAQMAWATAYRCGVGDWNLDQLLERAIQGRSLALKDPENRQQFLNFVRKIHEITGTRPPFLSAETTLFEGFKTWNETLEEAEQEKLEIVEWFEDLCLNYTETVQLKKADSEGGGIYYQIVAPQQVKALFEEARQIQFRYAQILNTFAYD